MNPRPFATLVAVVLLAATWPARSEKVWTNNLSGFWSDGTNWTGHTPPDITSFIRITNDLTKTVTIDALTPATELTVQQLWLNAPPGATNTLLLTDAGTNNPLVFQTGLDLADGADLHLTNSAMLLQLTNDHVDIDGRLTLDSGWINFGDTTVTARVGRATSGVLTINGGDVFVGTMTVGGLTNSSGAVNMTGGTLNVSSLLSIGRNPGTTGSLSMFGGQLSVLNDDTRVGDSGIGQMILSNATATLTNLQVGHDPLSSGTFTIGTGGAIQLLSDTTIARLNGSTGLVTIAGGHVSADGQQIYVGRGGQGQMNLSGGTVQADELLVAADTTNSVGGSGVLNIANGNLLIASSLLVGSVTFSTGQVFITGGTIIVTNAGSSAFVNPASGSISLSAATLTVDHLLITNPAGTFIFAGGTVNTRNTTVANGAPFVVGDGVSAAVLHLNGGTHSFANGLVISSNATLSGCGTVIGAIINHGLIATNCNTQVRPNIVAVGRTGTTATVTCSSVSGQVYTLQYKNALTDPTWTPITPGTSGTGANLRLVDPAATAPTRFYRVSAQ
jgi:fibronectin-binding autotransporter adhesin